MGDLSMVLTCRRACLLPVVVALGMALTACGGPSLTQSVYRVHKKASFKVLDRWVIKPPHEINATHIELTREFEVKPPADAVGVSDDAPVVAAEIGVQKLAIDLTNGRATLEDVGGRRYPQQVDLKVVRRIHDHLADRSWQVTRIKADRKAKDVATYHLVVYEAGKKVKSEATWDVPSRRPLPDVLQLLVNSFEVAHRFAYPLSDNVDLLK